MCNCFCASIPASYVATQYDAKALKQSREKLVDGHVGPSSRARKGIMGDVLPVDQHIVVGSLHGDDGTAISEGSGDGWKKNQHSGGRQGEKMLQSGNRREEDK